VFVNYQNQLPEPSATETFTAANTANLTATLGLACEEQLGFQPGTQDYSDCVTCFEDSLNCVYNQRWAALAGIILTVLTLLPCFFCCCCSSAPSDKYAY